MKISIAMATYNGEKYLPEQLQSFIDQTRQPDELIITDDCSTDKTIEILKNFSLSAPFDVILSHNTKNIGYAGNFNAALMQTTGEIVFLSDQDDVWFPRKIAYIENLAKTNPQKLIIMNDAALTDGQLNEVGLTKMGQLYSCGLNDRDFVMGCCCAIRRELLDLCLPIPAGYKAHDNWIVSFADHLSEKLVCKEVLQYYRRHESNESKFIANRTTKITRFDLFLNQIRTIKTSGNIYDDEISIKQMELFKKGVESAVKRKSNYRLYLQNLLVDLQLKIDNKRRRVEIRSKPIAQRFIAVAQLLISGNYRNWHGKKSAIRDIFW